MVVPNSDSREHGASRTREKHVVLAYRDNSLFRALLPDIEERLRQRHSIVVDRVMFSEVTTPPQMVTRLASIAPRSSHDDSAFYVTDVSVRRGIREMNGRGDLLLDAAHQGVLLDQSLATTVKKIMIDELRMPALRRFAATPSAQERAKTGELNLQAEQVFFEALLLPLVRNYPQFKFVIVAEKLLHHSPFVTYVGALQEVFMEKSGGTDPFIHPKLLAWDHPQSILSLPRIPHEVLSRLSSVGGGIVRHPCDWLSGVLEGIGLPPSQLLVVDTVAQIPAAIPLEDRHLHVILGDRHALEPDKFEQSLVASGMSADIARTVAAQFLVGPTFRLPLESLIADLADAGILGGTTLLNSAVVRERLADAMVQEIRTRISPSQTKSA